jgi:hypothetical protein
VDCTIGVDNSGVLVDEIDAGEEEDKLEEEERDGADDDDIAEESTGRSRDYWDR